MASNDENDWQELAKDPKRKAKSNDPGWQYAFWPNVNIKDLVKCVLCGNESHGGINRFKQHLVGGFPDIIKCPKTTRDIAKVMGEHLAKRKRNKQTVYVPLDEIDEEEAAQEVGSTAATAGSFTSTTSVAKKKKTIEFGKVEPKGSKSIASMFMKSPEQVIEERHSKGSSQTTLESRVKTAEEKERVHMHIADFFYENGISFNVANSRSYEIMVESIGQYGPGLKPPNFHELRLPLLKKAKEATEKLKEKHEKAWKTYGCTLMSDGWTDRRGRHLINFLANSPVGTFFLSSVNASGVSHDAPMLAKLLESKIDEIGEENVVQVVTDNGANYKAAGELLERRIPSLFWTPCAAHCIDLMLEDIGKLSSFKKCINQARRCTTFIYRHGRILDALREKTDGRDLVRAGATRFATSFLTLQSLYKYREPLRSLFSSEDWTLSKLAKTENGQRVRDTVYSTVFWNNVEDCIQASQPLLVVLRIVDGDEMPALAEIASSMKFAKGKITASFDKKRALLNKIQNIIEDRWERQMGKPLYGAALFLHPGKFFDILASDENYAHHLRQEFNDVLEKVVKDRTTRNKIAILADDYKHSRDAFSRVMAIEQRKERRPIDWWDAYGGRARELQVFAMRIVGLCCSSSGCERNWSTFEFIHTKRRNRLEHQRLNDLVYVQYNRKIDSRFKKMRELGKKFDPLILEDFQWNNEWISNANEDDDAFWNAVDGAQGASIALEGRNLPRRSQGESNCEIVNVYTRRTTSSRIVDEDSSSRIVDEDSSSRIVDEDSDEAIPLDDEEVEDDYGASLPEQDNEIVERRVVGGIELDDNA